MVYFKYFSTNFVKAWSKSIQAVERMPSSKKYSEVKVEEDNFLQHLSFLSYSVQ